MPTWSGILEELRRSRKGDGPPQFDAVRRKYVTALCQHTGREAILYASKAVKIIENRLGKAFIKIAQPMLVQAPGARVGPKHRLSGATRT